MPLKWWLLFLQEHETFNTYFYIPVSGFWYPEYVSNTPYLQNTSSSLFGVLLAPKIKPQLGVYIRKNLWCTEDNHKYGATGNQRNNSYLSFF